MGLYESLKAHFSYKDGGLYWKVIPFDSLGKNQVKAGDRAGWNNGVGKSGRMYRRIMFNGNTYYEHKLIYMWHHNDMPEFVDHKDNDSLNNDIDNLRPCTHQENMLNKKTYCNNKSGIKGVNWDKGHNSWEAKIAINKKQIRIGRFKSFDDAVKARREAELKHYDQNFYNSGG